YNFMNINIKELQKNYEVYYSNNLKNLNYTSISLSLSSSIGETGVLEFEFSLNGIDKTLLPEYIKSIKEKKKFFKLKDGSILKIMESNLEEINNIFSVLAPNVSELKQGLIKREKYYSYFFKERLSKIKGAFVSENLNNFSNNLNSTESVEIPSEYFMLRDYQKHGIQWLEKINRLGIGGILADDMGLGKTLQTIVYLDINKDKTLLPNIIIAPKSLVYNWKSEFQKFAPHLEVITLIGAQNERKNILDNLNKNQIIITSYGVLQRDIEFYENMSFKNIIIDEAQAIKNPLSKNGQCVKKLKGETKLALTGTPIENNLLELWSIFDFILPGYLNSHSNFQNHYIKTDGIEQLKTLTHPFILRRLKKDVLKELPEKIETDSIIELETEQKKLYLSYLSKVKEDISQELNDLNEGQKQLKILAILTRLRQICAHPKLFIENYKG
ncbi:MAG: SNF2-related protein, partial [Fusobacteriaceae bacterium]